MTGFHVIDAHNHVGGLHASGLAKSVDDVKQEVASRLQVLDARGVAQAVVIASHDYLRPDGIADNRRVNDSLAAYRDCNPERFPAAVGIVEPLNGERGLEELDRCKEELRFAGISFHTRMQGVFIDSEWVRRYLERMGELGLVPFIHSVGESSSEALWKIDVLAGDFPDLPMIVVDALSTFEQSLFAPHVADRRPNLSFDTALAHGFGFVAGLVAHCGASRVLYGSDLYSASGGVPMLVDLLADIVASELSEDDKRAILAGNITKLLGLTDPA